MRNLESFTVIGLTAWLVLGTIAVPAPAVTTVSTTTPIDGVSYSADSENGAAGATATTYDTAAGTIVDIPASVTISGTAYDVTTIGSSAFFGNKLTELTLPDSVTTINRDAFAFNQLTTLVLPDSVTTISDNAFSDNQLTTLVLPDSVTTLGDYAFNFNRLTTLVLPDSVTTVSSGAFANNDLTTLVLPDSVTTISSEAFYSNVLTELVLPDSVTTLGVLAFQFNPLESVRFLGAAPTSFGPSVFDSGPLVSYSWRYGSPQTTGGFTERWNHYTTQAIAVLDYDTDGGSAIDSAEAWVGSITTVPTTPTKTGYTFDGWYTSDNTGTAWNFADDVVTGDITFTARYADIPFTATAVPTVSGTVAVDQTLSVSAGVWDPSGATLTYQWLRDDTSIDGATGSTYVLTAADLGAVITVTVTAAKAGYITASTTSVGTAAVAATPFTDAPLPVVTGSPMVDQTLTANAGDWAPTGATLTYQWLRDDAAVDGATGSTYVLTVPDLGAVMTVEVTAVKTGYVTDTTVSVPSASIVAAPFTAAPTPTLSGTSTVGQTLTAASAAWEPSGATLSYQWLRDDTRIDGANGSTYRLTPADLGTSITVVATAVKTGYTSQTTTSTGTAAVAAGAYTTTAVPTLTGYAMVNQTLTATVTDWAPVASTITWQWLRGGTPIDGATDATYRLTDADEGAAITVRATGAATGYITETTESDATATVAPVPVNSTPTQTLTADMGGLITVSGSGFIPGESVDVWLRSTPVLLGTLLAAADGTVSGSFALPVGTVTGIHHIVLTGAQPGSVTSLDITVIGPAPAPAAAPAGVAGSLATSGIDASLTGWLALLLAASGLGLVLVRRRHAQVVSR